MLGDATPIADFSHGLEEQPCRQPHAGPNSAEACDEADTEERDRESQDGEGDAGGVSAERHDNAFLGCSGRPVRSAPDRALTSALCRQTELHGTGRSREAKTGGSLVGGALICERLATLRSVRAAGRAAVRHRARSAALDTATVASRCATGPVVTAAAALTGG